MNERLETELVNRILTWEKTVRRSGACLTSFLNPKEQEIVRNSFENQGDFVYDLVGEWEYKRLLLSAAKRKTIKFDDFEISLLEIKYPYKFGTISHSQILGAMLGETGLERKEIGDVLQSENRAQVFVSKKWSEFFIQKVKKIGQFSVELKEIDFSSALQMDEQAKTTFLLVSSLRVDGFISSALGFSRNFSANMIKSGLVKINYTTVLKANHLLDAGDLISIRSYGRIKLEKLLGLSKRGKYKIEVVNRLKEKMR